MFMRKLSKRLRLVRTQYGILLAICKRRLRAQDEFDCLSFVAQSDERVDAGGAACRKVAGQERDRSEGGGDGREGERVEGAHIEEHGANEAR